MDDESLNKLQQDLREINSRPAGSPGKGYAQWRVLCLAPLYREFIARQAKGILGNAPAEEVDEVCQAALEILGNKFRDDPQFDLKPERPAELFRARLIQITRNACRDALKRLRRIRSSGVELSATLEEQAAIDLYGHEQPYRDVVEWIEGQPEPICSIMNMLYSGHTRREIAKQLHLPYRKVGRIAQQAIRAMRKAL